MIEETPKKLSKNEELKVANPKLAGTIAETLADDKTDRFSNDDTQFLKFHGIYQQDDRDLRKQGKHFMFMIRGRIPGGVLNPRLYLTYDRLATEYGNNTLRVTTRQSFQFHGVVKNGLGNLMKGIHDALSTTLAACGDVARNVMAPPTPSTSRLVDQVIADSEKLSDALLPSTKAYHEIWVEGVKLNLEDDQFEDPLYGKTYLPRKFKTAFAIPPLNDTDVFTNCLGFAAISENDQLIGYNLIAGGGMGMNHNNPATFPRVADTIGFFPPEELENVAKAVLTVHRDYGDRSDRKHARLKYVLEEKGVEWFRSEVDKRTGFKLEDPRPVNFERQGDVYGWNDQFDGKLFLGFHILAGRLKDVEGCELKTAIREIVEKHQIEVRLTPSQNLILTNIDPADKASIDEILTARGVQVENQGTVVRRASMACPALPTCGLALAESERFLPTLTDMVSDLLAQVGLKDEEIIIRSTGCPNGCARPYMAELGLVGKAPNKYQIYVGGNESSTRLAKLFKENIKTDQLVDELTPVLTRFKEERNEDERFGDFCDRVLLKEHESATN